MSEINRGLDHMANQLRDWSPGRAVLSPDPGGLNRALDRAAAEHLREVAPHLAPKPEQAKPPLCRTCLMHHRDGENTLCSRFDPEPDGARDTCPRCGGTGVVRVTGITPDGRLGSVDTNCSVCAQLATAPPAPAPPAEAKGACAMLGEVIRSSGVPIQMVMRLTPEQACDALREIARKNGHEVVIEAPPAEAKGEMTPPHGIRCDRCLAGVPHERDRHCYSIAQLMEHIAALRTSAREAEERAEMYVRMHRQEVVDGVARLTAAFRERDEAREQREDLANEILAERSDLAAANARAEEAERKALMAGQDKVAAQRRADSSHRLMENERAARLKAEKEMNLLIGRDVPRLEERLAAAEAEERRVRALIGTRAGRTLSDAVADAMTSLREYHEGRLAEETGKLRAAEAEVKRLQKMVDGR